MEEVKEYITDDGVELTKAEAEELNRKQKEIFDSGDLEKMKDCHFILPKSLVKELKKREQTL